MAYDTTLDPRREKLDRLLLVADALENPPPNTTYEQKVWQCGTNACALGHALIKYGEIGGLALGPAKPGFESDVRIKDANVYHSTFDAIADTFGITSDEATRYFGAQGPTPDARLMGREAALFMAKELRLLHAYKVAELVL